MPDVQLGRPVDDVGNREVPEPHQGVGQDEGHERCHGEVDGSQDRDLHSLDEEGPDPSEECPNRASACVAGPDTVFVIFVHGMFP